MYKLHTKCRVCGSRNLESVADFGLTPLANDFRKEGEERAGFAPLEVLFCEKCALGQLSVVVNPNVLYSNYSYMSQTTNEVSQHMRCLIADTIDHKEENLGSVLEIGSNTGVFLELCKPYCSVRQGVDPASNLVQEALKNGIPTACSLFTKEIAGNLFKADTIFARHVFAHIDDWHTFFDAIDAVASDDCTVVIEVPYLQDMVDSIEWDSVYHEHLSYVSITAMNRLLADTEWRVSAVKRYAIHGGSIAFFIDKTGARVLDDEFKACDLAYSSNQWRSLANVFWSELIKVQPEERFGYGAPAKTTLWASYLKLSSKDLAFLHDWTPYKQNTFLPGTDIPVIDGRDRMKDCKTGVIFAWNYAEDIQKREKWFTDAGGKFIVPIKPKRR